MYQIGDDKYHRIVVEGPNCAGKTTLITELEPLFEPVMTAHWTSPPKLPYKEYCDYLYQLAKTYRYVGQNVRNNIIYDRGLASDPIHAPVYKGYDVSGLCCVMERWFVEDNWKQIYVTASIDLILARLKERGDWLVDEAKLRAIYAAYEDFMSFTCLPTFTYQTDMTLDKQAKQFARLKEWLGVK